MKISSSAITVIVIFFITLVFSNPLVSTTTSLAVRGQRGYIVPERKPIDVRKYSSPQMLYVTSVILLLFTYNIANHTCTLKQGAVKCNTDRVGHTNWASSRHTRKNYEWLFRNSGEWKAKAGQTGRVRCSGNAAIFVINTVRRHPLLPDLRLPLPGHSPSPNPPSYTHTHLLLPPGNERERETKMLTKTRLAWTDAPWLYGSKCWYC